MANSVLSVKDPDDLPALYKSADSASLNAQTRFLTALRIRLGGLLTAAISGATGWQTDGVELAGMLALASFAVAIGAELYSATVRPDRTWYEGRAAAESVKTLAWRYMVQGQSFDGSEVDPDRKFLSELSGVLQDLRDIQLADGGESRQITQAMRTARSASFIERRDLYLQERILSQRDWYARKANWNATRAHRWLVVGIVAEIAGMAGAAAMAFGKTDVDVLGVFAAIAATVTAWVQAKQHETLSTAYSVTAQELAAIVSELETGIAEENWAKFVGDSEEAISREHTLWRASRGLRIRPTRGL